MIKKKLEEYLDYKQPQPYIVSNEQYSNEYKTPVLTAGKSFLLGMTNDTKGIYPASKDEPIILFDDFTTDIKWVDFPFKVKSSACKILVPRNDTNLRFCYYGMKSLNFDASQHKRYWISQYSQMQLPDYPNARKAEIVERLSRIENQINIKENQLNKLDSLVKSRFMEMFTNVDKWKLSEMAEIIMGQSPDSKSYNESGNGVPFFQGKGDFGEKYTKIGHWTTSPTKTAKLNDVLMSVRAPVGPVNIASTDCCIGRGLCAIRAENGLTNSEFLYNALKVMEPEIALMGNGSTFKAINKKDVYSLLIPVASTQSQESFSKFASLIDKSRFVVHSRYFLWLNFTFVSSTIAYSRVVSILECPKRC